MYPGPEEETPEEVNRPIVEPEIKEPAEVPLPGEPDWGRPIEE